MTAEELVKKGYDAYGEYVHWQNYQGKPMPKWEDLGPHIQGAWAACVREIVTELQK